MYHALSGTQPPAWVMRRMAPGTRYLGEDATYWYFSHPVPAYPLGGFFDDVGKMFSRMVKFTPKSFTPGNIYKGFVNTSLTALTGGIYQFLPKNIKNTVYDVGKIAIPVVAGGIVAYTAGPAVMAMIGPKISAAASTLGKAASTVGGKLYDILGKLSSSGQAEVAQQITPEQIVAMEQTGQIPPSLYPLLQNAAMQALPAQPGPMVNAATTGAASLYDPSAMAALEMQRQQAAQGDGGGFDPMMLLLIGAPILAVVLMKK